MIVADVVIQTQPGRAGAVETRLEQRVPGFQSRHVAGGNRIVATWCVPSGADPQALAKMLEALDPDIVFVNPTIVGVIGG
jgi:hypothetical protein